MRGGDRVEIRSLGQFKTETGDREDSEYVGRRGTVIAVRTQRSEVGYLVLIDGEKSSIYFGPSRLIPISEDSSRHIGGAE